MMYQAPNYHTLCMAQNKKQVGFVAAELCVGTAIPEVNAIVDRMK